MIDPVIEIVGTKNNRKRFIPINDDLLKLLKSIRDSRITNSCSSDYVFLGKFGNPLLSVKNPFNRALKLAGISDFRFHDLRHTFASHYVMSGGDLMSLRDILGHSSLKMVERYSHLAFAYKRKMINNINGKFTICQIFAKNEKTVEIGEESKAS